MIRKSVVVWLSLLMVAVIALAGCAPRHGAGETAAAAGEGGIAVDLPAIVVDFNDQGEASVGNVPVAQLGASLGVAGLNALKIPPEIIAQLSTLNIQHIQINTTPEGLLLLVNGQEIPSIGWDGDTLTGTAEALKLVGVAQPALEKLLPLLDNIGIGVVARFPVAQGKEALPTYVESAGAAEIAAAQQAFLDSVGAPPQINLPIFYNADGTWKVADMTDSEWTALTGQPIWSQLRLNPNMLKNAAAAGIKEVTISTDAKGLHIAINGKALPYISWANGRLNNLIDLAEQAGLWQTLADQGINTGQVTAMIDQFLPIISASQANLRVFFPS
jgi:hypothetical protein